MQGISWQRVTLRGQANHAGTTPIEHRRDAGLAAATIVAGLRRLAVDKGEGQVATVGSVRFEPDLVNVVPRRATLTVDLRNPVESRLREAERAAAALVADAAAAEGVTFETESLARFEPVDFDPDVIDLVESVAGELGHSCRRIVSGAGHDAQMLARVCPTGMVFVPSRGGVSHNPSEHTDAEQLVAGADVLLHTLLRLAERAS